MELIIDDLLRTPRVPRSPRFLLRVPLSYRPVGEMTWRDAVTENISRSGVLFRTELPAPVEMPIEMRMLLPTEIAGLAATVLCMGRVVRHAPPTTDDARPAVAATILRYHVVHDPKGDPRRI